MSKTVQYSVMKDSHVKWIGQIPSSWTVSPLKYVFSIKKEIAGQTGFTVLSVTQKGIKPKNMSARGQFALDYSKYQLVKVGDFVMNHMDLLTGWVDISQYEGVTSPDYRVFVNTSPSNFVSEYYKYMFQYCYINKIFYGLGQGVAGFGRWRLPAETFLNFLLPVPSRNEQVAIATFLDVQCSKIDAIVAEARASIEEYKEWKKALIYGAVTKGLRGNYDYKSSELPWIGNIPCDWATPSVRNYFCINRGRVIAKTEICLEYTDNLYPVYSSQTKNDGCMGYINTYDFEEEGLTWTTDGANAGTVFYRNGKFNCTNVCGILTSRNTDAIYMPFCNYSIGLSAYNCRRADINGYKIMSNEMAELKFVLPSTLDEQIEIAAFLDEKCARIDSLLSEKEKLICDIEEYRRSLIYETVTGKRKVV